jgi:hypothetical protein
LPVNRAVPERRRLFGPRVTKPSLDGNSGPAAAINESGGKITHLFFAHVDISRDSPWRACEAAVMP